MPFAVCKLNEVSEDCRRGRVGRRQSDNEGVAIRQVDLHPSASDLSTLWRSEITYAGYESYQISNQYHQLSLFLLWNGNGDYVSHLCGGDVDTVSCISD